MENTVWIARHVTYLTTSRNANPPIHVFTGPKATGKTLLAQHLHPTHRLVTLSLPSESALAERDPTAFFSRHPPPVVIDDVHRALGLIRHVVASLPPTAPAASCVLVGGRPEAVEAAVADACGDHAALMRVPGLSHAEASDACPGMSIFARLLRGGFPALYAAPDRDPADYLRAIVADHLERELPAQLRVDSVGDFERFLRATARRTASVLNKAALAREIGIAGSTAAVWLDTLAEAGIVALVHPWRPASGRPLVKAPKLYFLDTGLCAHLLGLRTEADLAASPLAPALWESYVHAEIRRLAADGEPVFWRDRVKEADFLVPTPRGLVVCDASWSEYPAAADLRRISRIRETLGAAVVASAIVCRAPHRHALREPSGPAVETVGLDDLPALVR